MEKYWRNCSNVLCIRPDSMGDVLMTSPAFRALKDSFKTRITLLTSEAGSAIARYIPEVDEIITFNFPWEKNLKAADSKDILTLIHTLKMKKFDGAVIFNTFSQDPLPAALICYLSDIPRRLAFSHVKPYELLNYWIPDTEPQKGIKHEVERQLFLVESIGAKTANKKLSLKISPDEKKAFIKKFKKFSINNNYVLIHPGANSLKRQYDISSFARIAKMIEEKGFRVICTGKKDEEHLGEEIEKRCRRVINLTGLLTVGELINLISNASLLISNNSGPVHIAAAVGTPVVDLYALTNPQHTPWKVPSKIFYFKVPENLKGEGVISEEIPKNAVPVTNLREVVSASLDLLEKGRILRV